MGYGVWGMGYVFHRPQEAIGHMPFKKQEGGARGWVAGG
jgi:hypothetical protein